MKKLINTPSRYVEDALLGLQQAHSDLVQVDIKHGIVRRSNTASPSKVAIVSGGGSGHEPLHSGYVGLGMLDAVAVGPVFTSPTPVQIRQAILDVAGPAGALVIVKNYSGDVMNFEMAVEITDEVPVKLVTVADDVAIAETGDTLTRRGVGLTVLLEKIVGAAAEAGYSMDEIAALAERVIARGRSLGVALSAGTHPEAGTPTFELGEHELEFGVGIHGEPGIETMTMMSAEKISQLLTQRLLQDYDFRRGPVIAMLSGLGATPIAELHTVYGVLANQFDQNGVNVARNLVGNYVTALDMAGCTLTLLEADEEMLQLWDAPVHTPALRWRA